MPVTLVCYHYVRDLVKTRYPAIKGLSTESFRGQLAHLRQRYTIVSGEDLLEAARQGTWDQLPANSAVLTFDDGYLDHYATVFPLLMEAGVTGCFFPPATAVEDRQLLDVNKIHFILASAREPAALLESLFSHLDGLREKHGLPTREEYLAKLWSPGRYDPPEIAVFKRLLQRELPGAIRRELLDTLFAEFVGVEQDVFAEELYLTMEQARVMREAGMYFGSHGSRHLWLNAIPLEEAEQDIAASLGFLRRLGWTRADWIMCYPYGGYGEALFPILKKHGCALGFTTNTGLASPDTDHPLVWPRMDTNEMPKTAAA